MVSLVCPVQAISPWRDVWLIVEQPFSGGPEGAAPDGRPRRLDSGTAPSSAAGAQGADNSGRFAVAAEIAPLPIYLSGRCRQGQKPLNLRRSRGSPLVGVTSAYRCFPFDTHP